MKIEVKDFYSRNKESVVSLLDMLFDLAYEVENKPAVKVVLRRCIDDLCTVWSDENL